MPSSLKPQPWPWVGEPRVLVEHPNEAVGLALAAALRDAGLAVAVCPGPEPAGRCPLTGPEGCALAHGADVVVSSLGFERAEARAVVKALRTRVPETPLVVEVAPGAEAEWGDLLAGCERVAAPAAPGELAAAVQRALAAAADARRG